MNNSRMNNIEMINNNTNNSKNSNFEVSDERFVKKGREGIVNGSQWKNTGKYWMKGTNSKSRTTSSRGTHKVFKSRANEIKKAHSKEQKEKLKAEINTLQGQLAEVGFIQDPSERLRIRNSNGSFSYATQLRTGLSHNQLAAIEKKYEEANRVNAELAGMMGDLGVGGKHIKHRKHRKHHTKKSRRKSHKRRYTRHR